MAFDAFFLSAVLDEIRSTATGARVEKIHQPSRDTVLMLLRCEGGREKLLFAPNPAAPRLHLTTASPENPAEPPMFCMLLRKHLSGARLAKITQPPMERAATFYFDCTDEMGYPVQKRLVAELMGRTCNLYLLDPEGRIIDCLRRIGLDETSKRPALPGLKYQEPEDVAKANPVNFEICDYVNLIKNPGADVLSDRLMDSLGGLSPLVCREAALFAATKKLSNLIAFIDYNKKQLDGWTKDICDLGDLRAKFEAFGWNALEVDGHDVDAIAEAIAKGQDCSEKPTMIVLHTQKGKDCCFAEDMFYNHFIRFSQDDYEASIKWLDEKIATLREGGSRV